MIKQSRGHLRRGAATAELAIIAPVLVFLLLISVDFARVFYTCVTLSNCARNGAMWEANPYNRGESKYATIRDATLADATNLNDASRPITVTVFSGKDAGGRDYVEVTVSQRFRTVSNFPGIPDDVILSRTVRMAKVPAYPK